MTDWPDHELLSQLVNIARLLEANGQKGRAQVVRQAGDRITDQRDQIAELEQDISDLHLQIEGMRA